jgi:hypothetical protein
MYIKCSLSINILCFNLWTAHHKMTHSKINLIYSIVQLECLMTDTSVHCVSIKVSVVRWLSFNVQYFGFMSNLNTKQEEKLVKQLKLMIVIVFWRFFMVRLDWQLWFNDFFTPCSFLVIYAGISNRSKQ